MGQFFAGLLQMIRERLPERHQRIMAYMAAAVFMIAAFIILAVGPVAAYRYIFVPAAKAAPIQKMTAPASNNSGGQNGNVTNNGPVYNGPVFQSPPHPVSPPQKATTSHKRAPADQRSSNTTTACPPNTFDCELGTDNKTDGLDECGYSHGIVRGGSGNTQKNVRGQQQCPSNSKPN